MVMGNWLSVKAIDIETGQVGAHNRRRYQLGAILRSWIFYFTNYFYLNFRKARQFFWPKFAPFWPKFCEYPKFAPFWPKFLKFRKKSKILKNFKEPSGFFQNFYIFGTRILGWQHCGRGLGLSSGYACSGRFRAFRAPHLPLLRLSRDRDPYAAERQFA